MTYEELLEKFEDYAMHQSWRCMYRKRYGQCCCGLDALTDKLKIERIGVQDPEAD